MNQTYSLVKSRTFWVLVIMSVLPIVNAIIPTLPPLWQNFAEILLAVLGAVFHLDTAKRSGATNK